MTSASRLPEAGLALALEDVGDVDARAGLDFGVAVDELEAEPLRQLPADRALARAHRADEEDVHARRCIGVLDPRKKCGRRITAAAHSRTRGPARQ